MKWLKIVFLFSAVSCLAFCQATQTASELADKAEGLIRAGQAQNALAVLEQAAHARGATAESEDRVGFLLAVLGRNSDALEHFHKAIALNSDFAPAHYHLGVALFLAKDYDRGLPELQAAAKLAPATFDYRYRLGCGFLEMNNFQQAVVELTQAVALDASKAEAWRQLGLALHRQGDLAASADAYAHAVELAPQDDSLRNSYAALLVQTRQPGRAIEESHKVLARQDSTDIARAIAQMNIGYAYLKTGEFDKAEQAYRSAVSLDPKSVAAHYNLAIALKMKDQIEASQVEFQKSIDLDPTLAEGHYSLGIADWQLGDFPAAIAQMKAAIAIRPGYAEAHYMLAITLKQGGDLDAAIPELKEAIRLDPTTPGPYNALGQIFRIKGDKAASDEAFANGARIKREKDAELTNNLEQGMRGGVFPKPLDGAKE
jgi:tetratricopeptide (TPR) repeat protein